MKLTVDGKEIFTLSDIQKKVICNDISSDDFDNDMSRRLKYVLENKYDECFKRLKAEWDEKLKSRVSYIPTNPEQYAQLVFSQYDYKCRKTRGR